MKPLLDGVYTRPFITYKSNFITFAYLAGQSAVRIDEATEFDAHTFNMVSSQKNSTGIYAALLGRSIQNLFFQSGSHAFPNTALATASVQLPCYVLNIPQAIYGEKVKEGSLRISDYTSPLVYIDDGEGHLVISGSDTQIGYIFYQFGIAVIPRSKISTALALRSSASYYPPDYFAHSYFGPYFQFINSASIPPTVYQSSASYNPTSYFTSRYFGTYFQQGVSSSAIPLPSRTVVNPDGLLLTTGSQLNISFNSKHTIYEKTAICTVEPQEFNFSSNTSLNSATLSGSMQGSTFVPSTGSIAGQLMLDGDLTPYMTTVGLYNDQQELLAIAKFPRAIKRALDTQQTIIVRFDI